MQAEFGFPLSKLVELLAFAIGWANTTSVSVMGKRYRHWAS